MRRDGRLRREAILDAALQCFAARGVSGTGIEDIRRAASASPSSVYHLFSGLDELKLALLIRTMDRLFAHLTAAVVRRRTARTSVEALVRAHLDWVFAHPDEARVMYQSLSLELAPGVAERLQARKAQALAPLVAHFVLFMERGELPRWSPLRFDVVVLGASHEACRRWLGGAALEPRWMRAELPKLAWRCVAAG